LELERIFSCIDQLESTIDLELNRIDSLRQSILIKAFSGQLVPQDPTDEPASVLLDRIRAEHASQSGPSRRNTKRHPRGTQAGPA
jgi:type I restriction enzyme S subunit